MLGDWLVVNQGPGRLEPGELLVDGCGAAGWGKGVTVPP